MKCRLIKQTHGPNPKHAAAVEEALRTGQQCTEPAFLINKVGTIIEHADCWYLVCAGDAEPMDEECAKKSGRPMPAIVTPPEAKPEPVEKLVDPINGDRLDK